MAAAPQFIPYITQAGDRWDLVAWRFYGKDFLQGIAPLIQANPAIRIEAVFDQGLVIGVPLLVTNPAISEAADLPPWKQNS